MDRVYRAPGSSPPRRRPVRLQRPWGGVIRGAALALMSLLAPGVDEATGQTDGIFRPVDTSALTAGAGLLPPSAVTDAATLRRRLVSIDFEQLSPPVDGNAALAPAAGATGTLRLNLFDDASFTGVVERVAPTFSGGYSLSGRLDGVELGTVTLVVNGETVAGSVWTPQGAYRIRPAAGGLHTISEIDRSRLPPPGEPIDLRPGGDRDGSPPAR